MEDLFLTEPSKEYEESFKKIVLAYKEANEIDSYESKKLALENFDLFLENVQKSAKGIDIPSNSVARSYYWLIHNKEVIGGTRVRHKELGIAGHIGYSISPQYRHKGYGTKILKLALEKAYKLGINEAILTCNVNNIESKKIIEKNGGKYLYTFYGEIDKEFYHKFVIQTKLVNLE